MCWSHKAMITTKPSQKRMAAMSRALTVARTVQRTLILNVIRAKTMTRGRLEFLKTLCYSKSWCVLSWRRVSTVSSRSKRINKLNSILWGQSPRRTGTKTRFQVIPLMNFWDQSTSSLNNGSGTECSIWRAREMTRKSIRVAWGCTWFLKATSSSCGNIREASTN